MICFDEAIDLCGKSVKPTNLIASGESRRIGAKINPTLKVSNKNADRVRPFQGRFDCSAAVRRDSPDAIESLAFSDENFYRLEISYEKS